MHTASPPIAIVTGANRGIGLAITRQLAEQGIHVVATARVPERAEALHALTEQGLPVEVQALEVTEPASVDGLRDYMQERHGGVDILVNNAGIALDKWRSFFELDVDTFQQTLDTNLYGVLRCCQAFVPMMQARGYGRVVNISSELASLTDMQMGSTVAYRSSKTALNALTVLLARELAEYPDILVNAACPGWVKTELGGDDAPLSTDEGADTAVWLATLPVGAASGGLYRERQPYPW